MSSSQRTLLDWIAIESITGSEADYGDALVRRLTQEGLDVERQAVTAGSNGAGGRFNVLARAGTPGIVFCTHLDTVPPFFGPSEDAGFVHGRGACDAKGQALCMIRAARRLLTEGETRIGFLFTVGEELDSVGARTANERIAPEWSPAFIIVGEPTENRFVRAHKGSFKGRLVARGSAGHGSQAELPSAVHELVGCVHRLLAQPWGRSEECGEGTVNFGEIEGGVAPNVIAERASASIHVRTVEQADVVERRIRECLGEHVRLESDFENTGPQPFHVPPGEESTVVAFGTDAPSLNRWGTPLLFGPGRILDAHTDHERVAKSALDEAEARYAQVARELLARVDAGES